MLGPWGETVKRSDAIDVVRETLTRRGAIDAERESMMRRGEGDVVKGSLRRGADTGTTRETPKRRGNIVAVVAMSHVTRN
jgi:hypothetical protein